MVLVSQTLIAKRLNLSQRTVSLCLAGSDKVAANTRRRVLAVAEEMGYQRNRSALAMRTGRFNSVALLQSTRPWQSFLPPGLMQGIQQALSRRQMHLILASVSDEKLDDGTFLPSVLREWSVDGFLVNYNIEFPPRLVDVIESNNLPSVWINTKRPHDCVYPDDVAAGRTLTKKLLELGHQRIAFFTHRALDGHHSVPDRYAGYEQAMRSAGLQPQLLVYPDLNWDDAEGGLRYARSMLQSADRPTAVVAYEALEAHRILLASCSLRLKLPADLSLATFHENDLNGSGFPITVLVLPEEEMGAASIELLLRRVDGEPHIAPRAIEPWELVGASIGPPPARLQ